MLNPSFVSLISLIFLAAAQRSQQPLLRQSGGWLSRAAVGLALVALVGGLRISYKEVGQLKPEPTTSIQPTKLVKQQTNSNMQQTSTGQGSPNVQGVQGDVTHRCR
jgi:hypothetical protein